ncbi:MAG: DHA2 family efflux MFS transporter permease subunit [Chlamydiales bacterium]|nr:DHA2 family efflux MFS transporter permease subunit [Chlamydiales bacterium]
MTMAYETGWKLALLNLAIGLGTFIQVLDTSIANVAIPYIAGNLGVSSDEGTWVITAFAASNAIVLPLTGWLSNYFGRVRLFVWSILLFVLASFLCGLSTSLTMLVTLRVIQGAVAGSLIPLSQSLIASNNPNDKRGSALGVWAMIVIVAPILGPIIGGYLTEVYSWPWIFYINVPLGLISALIVWSFLKNKEGQIIRDPIDWTGLALLCIGVGSLQIMLDKGQDLDWFSSNAILTLFIVSLVSLGYFTFWNFYQKHPIVNFSFLKNRNFAFGTLTITLGFLIYFSSTVTLPLWLQTEQNYTAYWAGVAVAPVGIAPFFLSAWLGKNIHRFDLRHLAALSFFLFAISLIHQANFTTSVSIGEVMFARFLQSFGLAFFLLPILQLSLAEISHEDYPSATGLFHFIRILVGSGFGTSLSVYLWNRLAIFHHERLSETVTAYRPLTSQFYTMMKNYNSSFTTEIINRLVDGQVEQQAYMLATNDLSWLSALLFLAMLPLVYFCRKAKLAT